MRVHGQQRAQHARACNQRDAQKGNWWSDQVVTLCPYNPSATKPSHTNPTHPQSSVAKLVENCARWRNCCHKWSLGVPRTRTRTWTQSWIGLDWVGLGWIGICLVCSAWVVGTRLGQGFASCLLQVNAIVGDDEGGSRAAGGIEIDAGIAYDAFSTRKIFQYYYQCFKLWLLEFFTFYILLIELI